MATAEKQKNKLTFKQKIAAFGGTDGRKYYSKQKKLKQKRRINLILTTKESLKPVEDIYPKNREFELEETIKEETMENDLIETPSLTIDAPSYRSESSTSSSSLGDKKSHQIDADDYIEPDLNENGLNGNNNNNIQHAKSRKKRKHKQNIKKKIDKTPEIDYNELFGNNYDDNGQLIIGAINSKTTQITKTHKKSVDDTKMNEYDDIFNIDDLMIGKITSKGFNDKTKTDNEYTELFGDIGAIKTRKKSVDNDGMNEYDDIFNTDDLMVGKITSKGFNDKRKTENEYTELFGHIGAIKTSKIERKTSNNKDIKGVSMKMNDVNGIFDITEIDSIVSDLYKYDENMNDGLPEYDEYNSDEFSSENRSYTNSDDESYYSDDMDDDDDDGILSEEEMEHNMDKIGSITDSEEEEIPQPMPSKLEMKITGKTKEKRDSEILREIEYDQVNDDEMRAFENKRKQDMNDLMDGFFTDDDEDEYLNEIEIENIEKNKYNDNKMDYIDGLKEEIKIEIDEEEKEKMTLKALMRNFGLKTNDGLYDYYNKRLNIKFAKDLVDHLPTNISQPKQFKSTKIRMLLIKMSGFVMNKVLNEEWDGIKATEWKELETNKVSYIYAPPPAISKTTYSNDIRSSNIYFESDNNINSSKKHDKLNRLQMIGDMISFIDKKVNMNTECNVNIKIEQFPDINTNSKQQHVVIVGIAFFDKNNQKYDTLYISDRCAIYGNNSFLSLLSLRNCVMIENESEIGININNKQNKPIITFSHFDKNGKLYKHNKRDIVLENLEKQKNGSFIKIFIHQFYGEGIYTIHQILKYQDDETNINNDNEIKIMRSNGNNKSNKNKNKLKHRKSI